MANLSLSSLLREFWSCIASGDADKLATLQAWAEKRPLVRTLRSEASIRHEHNRRRLAQRWRGKPCFVCTELATQEHHIVQIQHGGTNRLDNKVWICNDCHKQIHPHLRPVAADMPIGIVPHMPQTERRQTCPACKVDVLAVQPVFRKGRYPLANSTRPILLRADAIAPYKTTDLHRNDCGQRAALNAWVSADLGRMARRDVSRASRCG